MSKLIRVRDKRTGHTVTINAARLNETAHEVVQEPAVDANGRPRGPVYATPDPVDEPEKGESSTVPAPAEAPAINVQEPAAPKPALKPTNNVSKEK